MSFHELCVIDLSAGDDLVFEHPGTAGFVIFLNVSRHVGIAPAAHRDIHRRQILPMIRQPQTKSDILDHRLDISCRLDTKRLFATPHSIAVILNFFRQFSHKHILP